MIFTLSLSFFAKFSPFGQVFREFPRKLKGFSVYTFSGISAAVGIPADVRTVISVPTVASIPAACCWLFFLLDLLLIMAVPATGDIHDVPFVLVAAVIPHVNGVPL